MDQPVRSAPSSSKHFALRAAAVAFLLFFGGLLLDGWTEMSHQGSEAAATLLAVGDCQEE